MGLDPRTGMFAWLLGQRPLRWTSCLGLGRRRLLFRIGFGANGSEHARPRTKPSGYDSLRLHKVADKKIKHPFRQSMLNSLASLELGTAHTILSSKCVQLLPFNPIHLKQIHQLSRGTGCLRKRAQLAARQKLYALVYSYQVTMLSPYDGDNGKENGNYYGVT